ncbi:hypothetical protein EDF56_10541 [Novosphingobium sp. PhB165]|uniref:hypothetical protein n=1 Tax=Novosphingobium sp. PhB165 TaxID=2485105 RepID=UPI001047A4C6|nr:hypothetical protein [Novosphingobium sp. PhB165]TCM17699.1 hypothetical protein EDF56_10541 [Novosphingobium sp. PhB165]
MSLSALNATAALAVALAAAAGLAPAATQAAKQVDPANLITLEQIDTPIVDAGRIDGVMHVRVVVEAQSASTATELTRRMPELRAASLAASIEFARLRASPFAALDVERLSQTLTPALKRVDPSVARVLIVRATAFRS